MNDLYRNAAEPAPQVGFVFDGDVLEAALRRIYERKFHPMTQIEEGLFRETCRVFHRATDEGFGSRQPDDPDYDFYQAIRRGNEVFSAFKVHRMQNDMAAQLLDEEGHLKPFEQWSDDVQTIADHQVRRWLRTEYDTAVIRAHRAADWRQFEREKDALPNLRWMPTLSREPYNVHKEYWSIRLTLPVDDPFWRCHCPGDHWNCKCYLEATDEQATRQERVPGTTKKNRPAPGLDNNPGLDARIFSESHPYIRNAYEGAKEAVEKFIDRLHVKIEPAHGQDKKYSLRTKELKAEAAKTVKGSVLSNEGFPYPIFVSQTAVKEWLNQPHEHYAHKNEMILKIAEVMKTSKYLGTVPKYKELRGLVQSHLFEIKILGDKSWIIVREYEDGKFRLYSITDSDNILNYLNKKRS